MYPLIHSLFMHLFIFIYCLRKLSVWANMYMNMFIHMYLIIFCSVSHLLFLYLNIHLLISLLYLCIYLFIHLQYSLLYLSMCLLICSWVYSLNYLCLPMCPQIENEWIYKVLPCHVGVLHPRLFYGSLASPYTLLPPPQSNRASWAAPTEVWQVEKDVPCTATVSFDGHSKRSRFFFAKPVFHPRLLRFFLPYARNSKGARSYHTCTPFNPSMAWLPNLQPLMPWSGTGNVRLLHWLHPDCKRHTCTWCIISCGSGMDILEVGIYTEVQIHRFKWFPTSSEVNKQSSQLAGL